MKRVEVSANSRADSLGLRPSGVGTYDYYLGVHPEAKARASDNALGGQDLLVDRKLFGGGRKVEVHTEIPPCCPEVVLVPMVVGTAPSPEHPRECLVLGKRILREKPPPAALPKEGEAHSERQLEEV